MAFEVNIKDGSNIAFIDESNALKVSQSIPDTPKVGTNSAFRYYNACLGLEGVDVNCDMNINGSATSQEFYIGSSENYDIHIMALVIVIADTKNLVTHNAFGGVTALTAGWDLIMTEGGVDTNIITEATTNGEVIAQSGFGHPYGDGINSWILKDWNGNDDALGITIPMHDFITHGIRIGRGTKDRIRSVINDDLTGLTEFTVRVIGYRHYPLDSL